MITIKKLRTLKENTKFRKYILLLQELENDLKQNNPYDILYFKELLSEIFSEENLSECVTYIIDSDINIRNINNLRHSIMKKLNIEPSEWDFTTPADKLYSTKDKLGINLYLDDIRSPFNLGSIFRTSECFGVSKIILSKDTTNPSHSRAIRTAMGCIQLVDWEISNLCEIHMPIFALELGGTPIDEFKFPTHGLVIIGSEELGVSPDALKLADSSLGRVTIPLYGVKSSLNVANATAILLQRWSEQLLKS